MEPRPYLTGEGRKRSVWNRNVQGGPGAPANVEDMFSTRVALALAGALLLGAGTARAASTSLCDGGLLAILNRPTIGYSTCAVARGKSIGEFGIQNTSDKSGTNVSYGQGFLRYGLGHGFEADINGPNVTAGSALPAAGLNDMGVGMKWQFLDRPTTGGAIDLIENVPSARAGVTLGAPTTTLNLDLATAVGAPSGFGITLSAIDTSGVTRSHARERYIAFQPSAAFTTLLDPRLQLYLEGVDLSRISPQGGNAFTVDGGFQYEATTWLELDIEAAHTTTNGIPSQYVGVGFGFEL